MTTWAEIREERQQARAEEPREAYPLVAGPQVCRGCGVWVRFEDRRGESARDRLEAAGWLYSWGLWLCARCRSEAHPRCYDRK